ncbi:MAG: tRNA 2-thiouridine(34) synthase MnmA [Thermodesulfobacteriota bacterium]
MSGGMDSLVAAYLLKQAGHPVFGIHFISGYESPQENPASIEKALDIPIHVIDCRRAFKQEVVDYFIAAYQAGETPNPCMVCNRAIKFGHLMAAARELGAGRLATGHYALCETAGNGSFRLKKGADPQKEQSYFLAMLGREQLARAVFPLGGLTKQAVRETAKSGGLSPAAGHESQDICFTRGLHYLDFIAAHTDFRPEPGDIVDPSGRVIGRHQGLHRYTVGQRRGINCPAAEPYYVIRLDMSRNQLVVGFKDALYRSECRIRDVNWISAKPETPIAVTVKIRYRHEPAEASLIAEDAEDEERAVIRFRQPQPAITPGQAAVCYQADTVVAGGWIHE